MQEGKEQTATGFLAAILIGIIIGTLGAYPINQWANKKITDAQTVLVEQLDLFKEEARWLQIATEVTSLDDGVRLGRIMSPVITRLENEAKQNPSKKFLLDTAVEHANRAMDIAKPAEDRDVSRTMAEADRVLKEAKEAKQ